MKRKSATKTLLSIYTLIALLLSLFPAPRVEAAIFITFPVIGDASFSNDFDAPRASGPHHAIDIIADKGQKLVAARAGVVTYVAYPQPSWGYMVSIRDNNGFRYNYLHINNDTPGTDDGKGGAMHAYAADIKVGNPIVRGQLIGWVGDSGNAENTVSHLHFEMIDPDGNPVNPYKSLQQAEHITKPARYPKLPNEILPFSPEFMGGASLSLGNLVTGGDQEMVAGAGPGGGPAVRELEQDGTVLRTFDAYSSSFRGGVDVALGDVDGDGTDEIITGKGKGDLPTVKIFKADGTLLHSFYAYAPSFRGGVRVAAGDVDGDLSDEIITGAGPGGGPSVRVFKADGTAIQTFNAYSSKFRGGVDVAAGDVTGTLSPEIITGAGPGGGPSVRYFQPDGTVLRTFDAHSSTFRGGIHVSADNIRLNTLRAEVLTVPATEGKPHIKMWDDAGVFISETMFMEEWWRGYHDIAAGMGTSFAATGVNRRTSIRDGIE